MISRKRGLLSVLALLVAVLALIAAGCGGDDEEGSGDGTTTEASGGSSGNIEALPSSSCTAVEYEGEGDPDVLIASDFPLQGSSRTQTIQIVEAIRYLLEQANFKAGDHNVAFQSCDDATAQAGKWDSGKCSTNAQAYAGNEKLVGVIGTFNSGCAAIEIPVLNQAPGGGVAMISPANTYVCLTEGGPGCDATEPDKYYPSGTPQLRPRRRERRVPGRRGSRVREGAGRHERLHPERQGGLRPRRRDELQERGRERRDQGRRLRGLGSEGVELRGSVPQDRRHRRGRSVPRRADRRERCPGDQGQGRRARSERRQGQAVRAGRVHDAADDRRGARGRSGHVPERRRRADRRVQGQGRRVRRGVQAAARRQGDRPVRDLRCAGGARSCSMRSRRRTARAAT